jgi:hypothetical protein
MKELDFDELDRAVNTLMSDVPKDYIPPSENDDIKTLTITPTLTDGAAAAFEQASVTPPSPSVQPVATEAPLAARRAGRFMDVVHPSSDMRTATTAPRPASRQGVTITPRPSAQPLVSEPIAMPTPMAEVSPESTHEVVAPVAYSDVSDTHGANDWPDPLEGYDTEPATENTATSKEVIEAAPQAHNQQEDEEGDDELFTIDDTESFDEPQPLTSPFLTDAKVEKRPLGTNTTGEVTEPDHAPVLGVLAADQLSVNSPDDQLPAAPEADIVTQLPEELQSELVAIEADAAAHTEPVAEVPTPVVREQVATPVETTTTPAPTGPTSITQQYHEEPTTGDQTNGAIYDTSTYHQPLAHPAVKKSGWMWVIWVLIILVLGAGSGVVLYLLHVI